MMEDRGSLIIMVGLPGSGKSTLAEIIAGYIAQRTVEILNGDRINRELNPVPSHSREELLALHEFIQKKAFESLLVGHVVIYDATNILEKYRKAARQIALRANVNYLIVDQKLIEQRLRSRTSDPQNYSEADLSIYQRMKERFEPILDEHITVQSSEDNFANLDVLLRRIQSLIEEK
jgi:predicted kinase